MATSNIPRLKIVMEDNSDNTITVGRIKEFTGNDSMIRTRPYCEFKPMYKINKIYPENMPWEFTIGEEFEKEKHPIRSKKSYKIEKYFKSKFVGSEQIPQYTETLEKFTDNKNILDISTEEYAIIYDSEFECFFVFNFTNNNMYKIDYQDIYAIHSHFDNNFQNLTLTKITKMTIFPNGKARYKYEKINTGSKLKLEYFVKYIENNFDVVNTIGSIESEINI